MIYLAFPGMGKTPLSKKIGKFIDLDFGFFRSALDVEKANEESITPAFSKLILMYEKQGFIVLTNDPKLVKYVHVNRMFLPRNPQFSARKMKVSVEQVSNWIADWEKLAKEYSVQVTYISTGLDHYLK